MKITSIFVLRWQNHSDWICQRLLNFRVRGPWYHGTHDPSYEVVALLPWEKVGVAQLRLGTYTSDTAAMRPAGLLGKDDGVRRGGISSI